MTFFEKNPQRIAQWLRRRRNGAPTVPQVVVHTYEAPHTRSLLAAATYLTQRADYGSYHCLAGAASPTNVLQLAPWSSETWHSTPNNNWSIGISAVAYAGQWNSIPAQARRNLVRSMAYAAHLASRWCAANGLGPVPARRITRAQAMARQPGIVSHAEMDPGRRTDPGAAFPWTDFMTEFRRLEQGGTTEEDPMPITAADLRRIRDAVWNDAEFNAVEGHGIPAESAGRRLRAIRIHAKNASESVRIGKTGVQTDGTLTGIVKRTPANIRSHINDVVGGLDLSVESDPAVVADALLDALPSDLADQVVTALAERLGSDA